MLFNDLTVLDLETTGLDPFTGRITEIAAQRWRGGQLVNYFEHLVWAGQPVPQECVALNGITTERCRAEGLDERDALRTLLHLCHGSVIVAHNAAFEMSWLHQACLRMFGKAFEADFLCTKTLAVAVHGQYPPASYGIDPSSGKKRGPFSLGNLCIHHEIELTNAHRAMPDVVATAALLDVLTRQTIGGLATAESLLNCCGMGPKHYPQRGLPAHAKPIVQ